jgi:hypothetical protein
MRLDLPEATAAWGSDAFAETLVAEIHARGLDPRLLSRLSSSGYPLATGWFVQLVNATADEQTIVATIGVQLQEIDAGCSCGFEAEPRPAYGEIGLTIDRRTGSASLD